MCFCHSYPKLHHMVLFLNFWDVITIHTCAYTSLRFLHCRFSELKRRCRNGAWKFMLKAGTSVVWKIDKPAAADWSLRLLNPPINYIPGKMGRVCAKLRHEETNIFLSGKWQTVPATDFATRSMFTTQLSDVASPFKSKKFERLASYDSMSALGKI